MEFLSNSRIHHLLFTIAVIYIMGMLVTPACLLLCPMCYTRVLQLSSRHALGLLHKSVSLNLQHGHH